MLFMQKGNASYTTVISVADDEDFISKEELQSIQKGLDDIKNGRTYKMHENESLTEF